MGWRLEHTYAQLPELFHARAVPATVRAPDLVAWNAPLAASLGLSDVLDPGPPPDFSGPGSGHIAALLSGNTPPEGARPLAQAYAGHQFGHFTTLGDGRAILLGEQVAPDGRRWDIQLKGAGRTSYSRRGDGRAALGPMLREYIISEAMHALGIPTSRSLAVVVTGEPVARERMLIGAVLTRVAASHIRVGTFEWAAAHRDQAALEALSTYTRQRHYPELEGTAQPHLALLDAIIARQAALIAQWQLVGFVHGVMNTDNMAVSGETIDYGPCAFLDRYDPETVFSSIDEQGRYAFGNQPAIAQWNLTRLAEAMLALLDAREEAAIEMATASLNRFGPLFTEAWMTGMRAKLGLVATDGSNEASTDGTKDRTNDGPRSDADTGLVNGLLQWMRQTGADYTNTFRALSSADRGATVAPGDTAFAAWREQWLARLAAQGEAGNAGGRDERVLARMRASNPVVIPRNHKVEEALSAASDRGDVSVMYDLLAALANPFDYSRDVGAYGEPPAAGGPRYRTFCGT